jgi:hypothetical protein
VTAELNEILFAFAAPLFVLSTFEVAAVGVKVFGFGARTGSLEAWVGGQHELLRAPAPSHSRTLNSRISVQKRPCSRRESPKRAKLAEPQPPPFLSSFPDPVSHATAETQSGTADLA